VWANCVTLIKLSTLSTQFCLLGLKCQNKFRIDTQSRWASDNPPLRDIASNNKGRVDNFDFLLILQEFCQCHQNFHMIHNMPFNSTPQFRNLVHHRNIGMLTLGTFHAILL